MADNHTYEIIIRADDGIKSPAAPEPASSPVAGAQSPRTPAPIERSFAQYIIAKTIIPYAQQGVNYMTSTVQLRTGSAELQQKMDLARMAVDTVSGGIVAASGGVAMAAGFGVSSGVGAGVALAIYAAGKAVDYGYRVARQTLEKAIESEHLAMARTRAGIAWNQRGE